MSMLAALSAPEVTALGGAITAAVAAIGAIVTLSPKRRGLLITNEQGAAQLRDAHIEALQRDLARKEDELERKDRRIETLEQQLDEARTKNEALIERFGTREDDGRGGGP